MTDCIFCKIAAGEIPSKKIYENDEVLAFHDISPMAPVHALVIPKTHIPSLDGITRENSAPLTALFEAIPEIARLLGLKNGYRLISNCGADGMQSVQHLHFHVLGGKKLPGKLV